MNYQIYNVSAKIILKTVEFSKKCEDSDVIFNKKPLSSSLNILQKLQEKL